MQYRDVKPATDEDMGGKLEDLRRLMGQFTMPEDGEFTESEIDKYVSGVRVYEDHFEWLLNLSPDTRGELDDAGSPVYFKTVTVTPDDERAWFKAHPQWSKSNKYAGRSFLAAVNARFATKKAEKKKPGYLAAPGF